ncbi:MAG: heat-inducible transcriptional repressor HrcA [Alphaproteobacteria bacterium]
MITELNDRSREILRHIVDSYVESGEPIGSRTLSKRLNVGLSPATIRNVMADLEDSGLLYSPHKSAGRLPTDAGLRLFVDGILEIGNLTEDERQSIDIQCAGSPNNLEGLLEDATSALSGLSRCASLVLAPKTGSPLRHIEFVNLSPGRALVVLVTESGIVENRVIQTPRGMPPSGLVEATNYLSARLVGRTLSEAYEEIMAELDSHRAELDELTTRVVESGLAMWAGDGAGGGQQGSLIVRGQAHLLEDVTAVADLEKIRALFTALETKEEMLRLLSLTDTAEGVQIFIGADNTLFNLAGRSMIVGPYKNAEETIIGAIGVIGPTRMNYAHIIPMVDYTSKLISRLLGQQS